MDDVTSSTPHDGQHVRPVLVLLLQTLLLLPLPLLPGLSAFLSQDTSRLLWVVGAG